MKKVTNFNKLALLFLLAIAFNFRSTAQSFHPLVPDNYVFDLDSLKGFDENFAQQRAMAIGAFGDEFKVFMYFEKRNHIKAVYNLDNQYTSKLIPPAPAPMAAACVNEDFESSGAYPAPGNTVNITTVAGIPGWTCNAGTASGSTASCLLPSITANPQSIRLISPPATGLVDAIIGSGYKIYSVFGNSANPGGTATPGVAGIDTMRGNWFVKINEQTAGSNINKISKTINVTSSNALFQFAFISVLEGAHCCCDNGAFSLKVKDCSNNILACPQFTAASPAGAGCSPTGTCSGGSNPTSYITSTVNVNWKWNRWKVATLDLTAYIGSCVTIDVVAIDCAYGGHAGYAYFDAQCLPMGILGNNTLFPAGTPNITLPTCGSGSSATITAPPGLTNYTWTGPGSFFSTAQTITTSITGQYSLVMNPPGACAPISRTVDVIISPAPNVIVSNQIQYSCSQPTVNGASIQMASGTPGGGTPNYTVMWSPAPVATVAAATTYTAGGLTVGINTITIVDSVGCTATTTINVTPAPPIPSFSLSAPSGTMIGCNPSTAPLIATNTSTLSSLSFTWTSLQTGVQTNTNSINGTVTSGTVNTYTVSAYDAAANSCVVTETIMIGANTAIPGCTVNPVTATLSCGSGPATFTAVASSTTNISGQWYDASGNQQNLPTGTPMLGVFSAPGSYVATFTNAISGCTSSQTVTVASNTIIPTMTVNTPTGTKITCATPVLTLNISASSTVAPQTYVWTHPTTGTISSITGGYSVNTPGTYTATFTDGNNCPISQQIVITIDTVKPIPTAITNLASNSFTLNCYYPVLTASAVTTPMLPVSSYSWIQPSPSLVVATHTMEVTTGSVTANPTTFTVLAAGANGCVGRNKVLFYEDLNVPAYKVVFTPTSITCQNQNIALSVVNTTTTGPVTFTIGSPAPTATANTPGALFSQSGLYTATLTNLSNGCTFTATPANVPQNTVPPATVATQFVAMPCGSPTVSINAGLASASSSYSYAWTGPVGAGIGSPSKSVTTVDMPGEYAVVITNTLNGCTSSNAVTVGANSGIGGLPVEFTASPTSGFAPLTVNVANTTSLGPVGGSVTTTWSYGNGSTYSVTQSAASTTLGLPGGSTTYNAAGVYTITLFMQASGTSTCSGTATMVVTVDNPSKVIVPNVFTPNGDGVNDKFMLNATNITKITCLIFDRWGVKMHDVTSETGNIGWDGKNLAGKDVPVGTYFYIITTEGKDGQTTEQKGTISLYR